MQLLVSVANLTEARDAVDGGADIVDAKDPSTGALGAVALDTLQGIHAAVGGRRLVSAALGDAAGDEQIEQLACRYSAIGAGFVKVGFAGVSDPSRVERLIRAAIRGVRTSSLRSLVRLKTDITSRCGVVAVAYADSDGTTSVHPTALVDIAARAGASGVLLDTADKGGPGLLRLVSPPALESWVARAHEAGLTVALAGKLTGGDLPLIRAIGADVAGVRGAACVNSRSSRVDVDNVRSLRRQLAQ